jgi:hypothetical protein
LALSVISHSRLEWSLNSGHRAALARNPSVAIDPRATLAWPGIVAEVLLIELASSQKEQMALCIQQPTGQDLG